MAPTPSPRPLQGFQTPSKTPHSKHRLHFPNTLSTAVPTEHPVEVIGRIRDYPDRKDRHSSSSALEMSQDGRSVRVRTDIGYRDFSLDGVSLSQDEDLEGFYKKFVESRIAGVRVGAKCTIMMYGPTGAGKSHTMFGCAKQPGIVYRALRDILGEGDGEEIGGDDAVFEVGLFVQVAVLEIYNEEIYDLLSGSSNGGGGAMLPKGNTPNTKTKLEVMGKKAKNATYILGSEAGKISKEVAKVEKRRIVKSTLCNERSSRSHCLIILDVPAVGGRLMLVDMAGSENIEQAGQLGFEAKMQTAKINQGNIALKRVVESIANGDSHVPFRDSKLTMLLQDSFEDDKSKILMILCASPDPKEMHKTISTLEYGAKAKCIVRAAHIATPKEKMNNEESSVHLRSKIVAMNQLICNLQSDNKIKEKKIMKKEEELAELRHRLKLVEGKNSAAKEEEINCKVDERTQILRVELMKMEEKMLRQQEELNMLRRRLEAMECEKSKLAEDALQEIEGGRFMKRLTEIYAEGDQGMEKSMELDMEEPQIIREVKEVKEDMNRSRIYNCTATKSDISGMESFGNATVPRLPDKVLLSTVFEREDEGEEMESSEGDEIDKEVDKEVVEYFSRASDNHIKRHCFLRGDYADLEKDAMEHPEDVASDRRTRIQNIFRLCGNHRELAQQVNVCTLTKEGPEATNAQASPFQLAKELDSVSTLLLPFASLQLNDELRTTTEPSSFSSETMEELKENSRPQTEEAGDFMEVYVKWELSKESSGNIIKKLKVLKDSSLSDLRKLIETHLEEDNNSKQPFTFLLLRDPSGAPVSKEKEATIKAAKLPICNNQLNVHLACLRPIKSTLQQPSHIPFASLENTLPLTLISPPTKTPKTQFVNVLSPDSGQNNTNYLAGFRV